MHVNRFRRARARAAVALTSLALLGTAVSAAGPATAAPQAPTAAAPACSTAYKIEQVLDGGTTWRMCWHYNTLSGLVLDDVSYQPKDEPKPIAVLTSARLAQVHVPYDDGENEYDDVTGTDFGYALQNLKPGECPGGTIKTVKVPDRGDVQGLCTTTRARGHAYRLNDDESTGGSGKVYTAQGKDLLVYTVNKASWYEYITEWRFSSDGTITSNVGATGSISPYDYNGTDGKGWPIGKGARAYAESHAHNVFWRLNFGLDGSPKSKVEQYDSKVTAPRGSGSPTTKTTRTPSPRNSPVTRRTCAGGGSSAPRARTRTATPGPTSSCPAAPASSRAVRSPSTTCTSPSTRSASSTRATTRPGTAAAPASTSGSAGRRSRTRSPGSTSGSTTSPGTRTSSRCRSTGRASHWPPGT